MLGLVPPLSAPRRVATMTSFRQFLVENKLWWILPIVIVLALVGYLLIFGGPDGAADSPFNYDMY